MPAIPKLSGAGGVAFTAAACLALPLLAAAPALALVVTIPGTGQNSAKPIGSAGTDSAWQVVQLPSVVNGSPTTGTPPYSAWIPANVPAPWLGSGINSGVGTDNNNGVTIGANTYRWVSASDNDREFAPCAPVGSPYDTNSSNFITCPTTQPYSAYSYILKQDFTVPVADTYVVDLGISGDNESMVYINGLIDQTNTQNPTITGGTFIGSSEQAAGNLGRLTNLSSNVFLNAGTNSAYIVVRDYFAFTGVISTQFTITTYDAPGPLPLLGAGAAFGWSRRLRRRLRAGAKPPAAS
jgi:hypothetical protein